MARRHLAPVALLALAACGTRQADTAPRPLVPKNGPEANVRVEYDGGVFNRRLSALFSVKRPAYVMVAHLGGDGVIRVLFPEDARETGLVPGGKTFRTDVVSGDYDAAPGYWFMRPTLTRSVAARNDSYDGNGHGFVFMIASASPLRFENVSEFGLWNEFELPGYVNAFDPRTLIRQYADQVSPGGRYTLDYASSMSSFATNTYADQRMSCAMMASYFSLTPWSPMPYGIGHFGFSQFGRGSLVSCMNYFGGSYYAYGTRWPPTWFYTPVTYNPPTPEDVATPRALNPRDGRRDPLAPGRDASSSQRPASGRRFDPDRPAAGGERVHRAPATPRRDDVRSNATSPRTRDYSPRDQGRRADAGSSGGSSAARPASASGDGGRSGDNRAAASEMKGRNP